MSLPWAIAVLLTVGSAPALAHDGLDGRLARADERVADAPHVAGPRIARAELHREHEDLDAAAADLARAAELLAGARTLPWVREQVRLAETLGLPELVDELLARYLADHPADGAAWSLAADVLARRGAHAEATGAHELAFAHGAAPSPDRVLAAAASARAAGLDGRALGFLDGGVAHLGPVPAVVLAAVAVERAAGRPDAALDRLAALLALDPDQEQWLALEGDLHHQAGRGDAARLAWSRARELHHGRSLRRRASPSGLAFAEHLDVCLGLRPVATPSPSARSSLPDTAP